MIVKRKGEYYVLAETLRLRSGQATRRNLGGPYETREEAVKRLRQVEYFKHLKKEKMNLFSV